MSLSDTAAAQAAAEAAAAANTASGDATALDNAPSNTPVEERVENWGTIFAQGREHALGGIEQARSTYWTEGDESAYLERVKAKATAVAGQLLEKAKQEVALIQEAARQEGYNQGLAEAQEELEAFRSGMADSVASVLSTIEEQCPHIFQQWRDDVVAVARLAVEKATGIVLNEERSAVLAAILVQSLDMMEQNQSIVVCVHPDDEPVIADIVQFTKEKYPAIAAWKVVGDASLTPGSLQLENESSLAQSYAQSRLAAVDEVLRHLVLPETP